jgi:hypothetical protein
MVTGEAMKVRLRVLPGPRGGWRVEDPVSVQAVCGTPGEAEALAEQLAERAGGGEVALYDAYLRLRAVKRLSSPAHG